MTPFPVPRGAARRPGPGRRGSHVASPDCSARGGAGRGPAVPQTLLRAPASSSGRSPGAPARSSTARGRARLPGGGDPLVAAGKRGRRPRGELASSWVPAGVRGSRRPGGSGAARGRRRRRLPRASGRTDRLEAEAGQADGAEGGEGWRRLGEARHSPSPSSGCRGASGREEGAGRTGHPERGRWGSGPPPGAASLFPGSWRAGRCLHLALARRSGWGSGSRSETWAECIREARMGFDVGFELSTRPSWLTCKV